MPNFPSIYLELQELWKRIKKLSSDLSDFGGNLTDYENSLLTAEFISSDGDLPSVQAIIDGGTPPYTYEWSIQQGTYNRRKIISNTNESNIVLTTDIENNSFIVSDSTNLKLKVEDSNGRKKTFYHVHNVIGYTPMTMNTDRQITTGYCSDGNMITASVPWYNLTFLDNYKQMNVYNAQENLSDREVDRNYGADTRLLRDNYTKNLYEKMLVDSLNSYKQTPIDTVKYTSLNDIESTIDFSQYNDNMNIAAQATLNSGSNTAFYANNIFRKINIPQFGQPRHDTYAWNLSHPDLGNKSIKDHIGDTDIVIFGNTYSSHNLPLIGAPGRMIYVDNGEQLSLYAWSAISNSWDLYLASVIEDIMIYSRARRDAYARALRECNLASSPFLAAAYNFPLHKIR